MKVSPGGLTQVWNKLAELLTPVYDQIGQKVKSCAVLNCDETGWRLNGLTHWLWCFTSKIFCYYVITRSRGSAVVRRVLGNIFTGILICDFWGAYNKIDALAKQRCVYHLFTELKKVSKYKQSLLWKAFRKTILRLFRDAIRLWSQKEKLDTAAYDRRKKFVIERFPEILSRESQDKDVQRLIKRFARHKDEMFTFLDYNDVSPYNNHGEQQMRSAVMTRKVSQQNRSRRGADTSHLDDFVPLPAITQAKSRRGSFNYGENLYQDSGRFRGTFQTGSLIVKELKSYKYLEAQRPTLLFY